MMALRFVLPALLITSAAPALAQQYVVSVSETGPLPTAYEKRNNWRFYGDYRHTTMMADSSNPLACQESPCLDDGEPGDKGPDGTRGGTATAQVPGMAPGKYRLELRYNQTANRSTAVPWKVSSDAASNNALSGTLDQKNTPTDSSKWLVLGQTDKSPIAVQSSVTFVFGSATVKFSGSLSYGGIRLVKIAELTAPIPDAGAPDASALDASDAGAGGAPDAAADAGVAGAGGSAASGGSAAGGGTGVDGGPDYGGGVDAADAGCGCVVGEKRAERLVGWSWLALAVAAGGFRRRG
ncbi:MAG: hypothetical protein IT377_02085 [Polyangiaceae bacterium]|nr:hypothetical protein [Polyangiaceae bacterium]